MAGHDSRVNLIASRGRQLGRSLLLLAHYIAVCAAFTGRSVRWMVEAMRWLCLFARYTTSMFDSIFSLLTWGRRRRSEPGSRGVYPVSDRQQQPDTSLKREPACGRLSSSSARLSGLQTVIRLKEDTWGSPPNGFTIKALQQWGRRPLSSVV
ncbi:hypothetical protein WMY93_025712 [Mugilogobius chulae]|uniref:Uncharacterized protein n=1 Tax=Mugilogobius chulae TaxID=88201 RepID=A0AAW0N5Q8_9GOBI